MNIKDFKVGEVVILNYDGYYLPKQFSGVNGTVEKINRKLITVSSKAFTGTYNVGLNNLIKRKELGTEIHSLLQQITGEEAFERLIENQTKVREEYKNVLGQILRQHVQLDKKKEKIMKISKEYNKLILISLKSEKGKALIKSDINQSLRGAFKLYELTFITDYQFNSIIKKILSYTDLYIPELSDEVKSYLV